MFLSSDVGIGVCPVICRIDNLWKIFSASVALLTLKMGILYRNRVAVTNIKKILDMWWFLKIRKVINGNLMPMMNSVSVWYSIR